MWDAWSRLITCNVYINKQFNGMSADCAKIREINAAFSQGRMYFENAKSAGLGVKPLLLLLRSHVPGSWTRVVQVARQAGRLVEIGAWVENWWLETSAPKRHCESP